MQIRPYYRRQSSSIPGGRKINHLLSKKDSFLFQIGKQTTLYEQTAVFIIEQADMKINKSN